jgi:hypothetical protein
MNAWLQDSTVDVEFEVEQQPGESPVFIADPDRTVLNLPPVGWDEYEKLPDEFDIKVVRRLEDDQARFAKYYFRFHVKLMDTAARPDGLYDLHYSQSLFDYGRVT